MWPIYPTILHPNPTSKVKSPKVLNKSQCYSVSFDESLNKTFQLKQMDLNAHYWDFKIDANYFICHFFNRPNVENIHQELNVTGDKATDWEFDKAFNAMWKPCT